MLAPAAHEIVRAGARPRDLARGLGVVDALGKFGKRRASAIRPLLRLLLIPVAAAASLAASLTLCLACGPVDRAGAYPRRVVDGRGGGGGGSPLRGRLCTRRRCGRGLSPPERRACRGSSRCLFGSLLVLLNLRVPSSWATRCNATSVGSSVPADCRHASGLCKEKAVSRGAAPDQHHGLAADAQCGRNLLRCSHERALLTWSEVPCHTFSEQDLHNSAWPRGSASGVQPRTPMVDAPSCAPASARHLDGVAARHYTKRPQHRARA